MVTLLLKLRFTHIRVIFYLQVRKDNLTRLVNPVRDFKSMCINFLPFNRNVIGRKK